MGVGRRGELTYGGSSSMNSDEGGAPMILGPRRGVGQHQGTPAMLLVLAPALGRL
jgi:hypothetical protein